jgi:hypothetical protein
MVSTAGTVRVMNGSTSLYEPSSCEKSQFEQKEGKRQLSLTIPVLLNEAGDEESVLDPISILGARWWPPA